MLVAGFGALASAQTAKAQREHRTPEQKAQHMTRVLEKKLNLTADQSVKVKSILLTKAVQMDSLKQHRSDDRKANRQARKAILMNLDGQLKEVLNADQQKTYAELKASLKERVKHKRNVKTPSEG